MQLTVIQTHTSPVVDEFVEKMTTLNLSAYASEAAIEMEFDSLEELHESVKRAMELCMSAGIPVKGNFQRVYKSSVEGILYDWKLSTDVIVSSGAYLLNSEFTIRHGSNPMEEMKH